MKFTTVEIRCDWYAILGHEKGRGPSYDPEAVKISRLECDLAPNALEFRIRNGKEPSEELLEDFQNACMGKNERWKLMNVTLRDGEFSLGFADTSVTTEWGRHPGETIWFRRCNGRFNVKSVCHSRGTAYYQVAIFNPSQKEPSGSQADEDEGDVVAVITEYADADEAHLIDTIIRRHGGYFIQRRMTRNPCMEEVVPRQSER